MKLNLKEFKSGQLCYVVLRNYRGLGRLKIILHEAKAEPAGGFSYGAGKVWTVNPAQLMGASKSIKKAAASKLNGLKGGRPITKPKKEKK